MYNNPINPGPVPTPEHLNHSHPQVQYGRGNHRPYRGYRRGGPPHTGGMYKQNQARPSSRQPYRQQSPYISPSGPSISSPPQYHQAMPFNNLPGPFDPDKYGTPTPRVRHQNGYLHPKIVAKNNQTTSQVSPNLIAPDKAEPVSIPSHLPLTSVSDQSAKVHSVTPSVQPSLPPPFNQVGSQVTVSRDYKPAHLANKSVLSQEQSEHIKQQIQNLDKGLESTHNRETSSSEVKEGFTNSQPSNPTSATIQHPALNAILSEKLQQIPVPSNDTEIKMNNMSVSKPLPLQPITSNRVIATSQHPKERNQSVVRPEITDHFPPLQPTSIVRADQAQAENNSVSKPHVAFISNPETQETSVQKLQRLRQTELQKINSRNRIKTKDGMETTSLKDLELARSELSPVQAQKVYEIVRSLYERGRNPVQPTEASMYADAQNDQFRYAIAMTSHPANQNAGVAPVSSSAFGREQQARGKAGLKQPRENGKAPKPLHQEMHRQDSITIAANMVAPGHEDPEAEDTASDDSIRAMRDGDLPRRKLVTEEQQNDLVGWDGQIQPPPVDWNDRPKFNNTNPEFKNAFNNWMVQTYGLVAPPSPDDPFRAVSADKLMNTEMQADGLDMVSRTQTVNMRNAAYYGYYHEPEITRESNLFTYDELDQQTELDLEEASNRKVIQETTEFVVQSWLAHKGCDQNVPSLPQPEPKTTPKQPVVVDEPVPNVCKPKINIYLRPAVRSDMPQMMEIYNWHVESGTKTAESARIIDADMQARLEAVTSTKLPFIVAVERSKKYFANQNRRRSDRGRSANGLDIIGHSTNVNRQEKIVGWACAQDFTSPEYVEHISAEVEIYVDPDARQNGIGQCLMDKLLEATDRSYMARGGYSFYCASELSHLYSAGGGRDLHKVVFVVRTWQFPKIGPPRIVAAGNQTTREDDTENELEEWLQPWLESWGFEHEGTLRGIGMKQGRFLSVHYFSRETGWQPEEGKIPALLAGSV